MARAYVGTSGWAYATWKPLFYPPETKTSGLLRYYATRLSTTEVNYTFRHLPTEKTAAGWLAATPPDFTFALKASERITHVDRLRHPADTLPLFFERARLVGDRLGPILFQTPPTLKRDDDVLAGFVASLPDGLRCALEVRHASWYAPEVYELLAARGVALVHDDGEGHAPSPLATLGATAPFAYLRLRSETPYDDAQVARWAAVIAEQVQAGRDVYAYLRHDDDGQMGVAALKLRELARSPETRG
ncbi:MAG: DUF72 domain-containing protein [Chloroflexota bacterium]|nr:DUF72 domain-containing protein [Chloroflexota bacterium]MDE3193058.1 DUF72 domain-containing protein [Chloroflexota bacterium]